MTFLNQVPLRLHVTQPGLVAVQTEPCAENLGRRRVDHRDGLSPDGVVGRLLEVQDGGADRACDALPASIVFCMDALGNKSVAVGLDGRGVGRYRGLERCIGDLVDLLVPLEPSG